MAERDDASAAGRGFGLVIDSERIAVQRRPVDAARVLVVEAAADVVRRRTLAAADAPLVVADRAKACAE